MRAGAPGPGQAGALAEASSRAVRPASSRISEIEHPAISSAVRKLPHQARSTRIPRASHAATASRATISISMVGVPPRLFTSSAA